MNRRHFLKSAAAVPLFHIGCAHIPPTAGTNSRPLRRVRPGEPGWPSPATWAQLKKQVGGRLIEVLSPLAACQTAGDSAECRKVLAQMKNQYFIGDHPALTQAFGWVDAWTMAPSVYAVAATSAQDVAAAVNFARDNNLRLVVKGGGHSYKGTSCAEDSLLIWTRAMNHVVLHDAFVPRGCEEKLAPRPAVSVGAGAVWMQAYDAVTNKGGRYVQGGGCTTVGVAGLIQSGGFGSFSKNYGMAAAALLEAEVVTADGSVRIANACNHPDLFWGIKGGGGGSLGVVTRVTLRTRELPEYFGGTFGTIRAKSDAAFRKLILRMVAFYHEHLFNRHWGEQVRFSPDNSMNLSMVFQGLDQQQAAAVWRPFLDWVAASPRDFAIDGEVRTLAIPARDFWNAEFFKRNIPTAIVPDDRPGGNPGHFVWSGDHGQAGQVLHAYKSAWLPASLLERDQQPRLADALYAASRHWTVSLHFNKGLAGAPPEEIAAARDTATNPAVLNAFALAIIATGQSLAFPGIAGHEPDILAARRHALAIAKAMDALLNVVGKPGSYVSESDFFEPAWQKSFWGPNHPRLAAVKGKYDPDGLFFVHQGVGSEEWSADGFVRLTENHTV